MPTYLLAWNPKRWDWSDLSEDIHILLLNKHFNFRWSCGNSKQLRVGDRVFLIRLGQEPRGVMGSGFVTNGSYEDLHWDNELAQAGQTTWYIDGVFDVLLNPDTDAILPRELLRSDPHLAGMHWDTQSSGIRIPELIAHHLEAIWKDWTQKHTITYADEISEETVFYEGAKRLVFVNSYERNLEARRQCIQHYGAQCTICGFDFEKAYGRLGKGYIHVHHLKPLSEINASYRVDPVKDLRPVCPNCHAMIHQRNPPYYIEEIQSVLGKQVDNDLP